MTFTRGGKIVSGSTITTIATLAGVCLGMGEWDEEVKINDKQRARVRVINVSNQLTNMGYTVLTNYSSNDDWNDVLFTYNSPRRSEDEVFKGSDFRQETRNGLKRKCIFGLAEEVSISENTNLPLVKRWCVKPETITDVLGKLGYEKIGDSNVEGNKPKWQEKIDKIKELKKDKKNIEFKKLGEQGEENIELKFTDGDNQDANIKALEEVCTKLEVDKTKTNWNKDFETRLNHAKEWCFWKQN